MIVPIIILFSISAFFFVLNVKKSNETTNFILVVSLILLTLIATFRPEEMADRQNYEIFFIYGGSGRFEFGFSILTDLIRLSKGDFYIFLAVFAFVSVGLKLWAIKRMSSSIWGSLLIYLSYVFIYHDMITMRAAVASGLLLHAVYYKVKGNINAFLITVVLAILFHSSAFVILPLWLINARRFNKWFYIGLICLAYILAGRLQFLNFLQLLPITGVQELASAYESNEDVFRNIYNLQQLMRVAISVFMILRIQTISLRSEFAILLCKIYVIGVAFFPLFSNVPIISSRICDMFLVTEIISVPMLVYSFNGKYKGIIKLGIITIGAIVLSVMISSDLLL